MKLSRGLSDPLPAAALDCAKALNDFSEGRIVEQLEVLDVEAQQAPLAAAVAFPATLAVYSEDVAEEVRSQSARHFAVRIADVDLVAIAQMHRHGVILAADSNQDAGDGPLFPEWAEAEAGRLFESWKLNNLSAVGFPEACVGFVLG